MADHAAKGLRSSAPQGTPVSAAVYVITHDSRVLGRTTDHDAAQMYAYLNRLHCPRGTTRVVRQGGQASLLAVLVLPVVVLLLLGAGHAFGLLSAALHHIGA